MAQKELNNSKWHGHILRYVPLILWIGVILFASTTQGSMSETSRFIRPILEFFFPNAPEETLIIYHAYIRKFAHFAEYAVLAFLASRSFWNSSIKFLQRFWYLFAFILVLLIASTDEINQSFNTTRTGSIKDAMIDAFGGATMILLLFFYGIYRKKRNKKKAIVKTSQNK